MTRQAQLRCVLSLPTLLASWLRLVQEVSMTRRNSLKFMSLLSGLWRMRVSLTMLDV